MEVRVSSRKSGLLLPYLIGDSETKDKSEGEDDDNRNHKHRKRDIYSQSLDEDYPVYISMKPYRKRNKHFESGRAFRGGDIQSDETWKNLDHFSGREFTSRFEKRRPNQDPFPRVSMDFSQRISRNQPIPIGANIVRGRVREPKAWGLHDSGDLASRGPFSSWGIPNPSNGQGASWNACGLVPGAQNGGMDAFNPLSSQAALESPISSLTNIGIPQQLCRDFEELGFCMRGDSCPMEHGVNCIVIDDVQSLSQFNLPVSVPASEHHGISAGQGALPVIPTASCPIVNAKTFHAVSTKPGVEKNVLDLTGGFVDDSLAGDSDVYNPDQPLWTNDNLATSSLPSFLQPSANKMEFFMDKVTTVRPNCESGEGFDENPIRTAGTAGNRSSSVWARLGGSKTRLGRKEKMDFVVNSRKGIKYDEASSTDIHDNSPQGNRIKLQFSGPSQKALCTLFVNGIPWKDNKREALLSHFSKFGQVIDIYIPMNSEKAFVQFLKRSEAEAALKAPDAVIGNRFIKLRWANRDNITDGMNAVPGASHPSISDKGNENSHLAAVVKDGIAAPPISQVPVSDHPKFIVDNGPKTHPMQQEKLETGASHTSISDKEKENSHLAAVVMEGSAAPPVSQVPFNETPNLVIENIPRTLPMQQKKLEAGAPHPSISDKGKENSHLAAVVKDGSAAPSVSQVLVSDHPKLVIDNSPKILPIQQNKLENVELLREEVRKKQEMLDQKRNEIRRQLNQLQKQATRLKNVATIDAPPRLKGETPPDNSMAETAPPPPTAIVISENIRSYEKADPHAITSSPTVAVRKHSNLRASKHSVTPPFLMNRFKLDNRPTAFKIGSPLPANLANAATLEEHFSSYGHLSSVEVVESESVEATDVKLPSGVSALIYFTTRRSAEKAFLYGKSWRGHSLHFTWLATSTSSGRESVVFGIPSSISEVTEDIKPGKFHKGDDEPGKMRRKTGRKTADQDEDSISA